MPQSKHLAAAIVFCSLFALSARATITATLVQGPNPSAGGILDSGGDLTGYTTYNLNVTLSDTPGTGTNTGPDDWLSAEVQFDINPVLGKGFYNTKPYSYVDNSDPENPATITFSSNDLKVPEKFAWTAAPNRMLQYDTWVAAPPSLAIPVIAGKAFPSSVQGTEVMEGTTSTNGTEINVAWGDTSSNPNTAGSSITYTIARFAVPIGASGFIRGNVYAANDLFTPVPITSSLPNIAPEPTSIGLLAIGSLALLRRNRRRTL